MLNLKVVLNMEQSSTLVYDSICAVENSKELRSHKGGKNIKCKYHLMWEILHQSGIEVMKIASKKQPCWLTYEDTSYQEFLGSFRRNGVKRHVFFT